MPDIQSLVVLKKLTVHNITVEPKRVKAVYTAEQTDGSSDSRELIYSYDKPIFEPRSYAYVNLASVMLAQVAINYGLFCREIAFDGIFDEADQRLIRDMMENTAREIYVNKFLQQNPFILPPLNALEPQQLSRYCQANITFSNSNFASLEKNAFTEEKDYSTYTILSSGGKDSLLTYGLVNELGTAHPVFINEAGRHWFTAVNAYRWFAANEPNTAKPWCNSDRIFNWMVRQFSFIRPDYASIRADIYPIRLWTVAVFLFGTLPIALKRRTGNVLIGNEYDCTLRTRYEGITHYNALYDQSKYFDQVMTRYFYRKGWKINQFSMLRSLSELLILKVLVKRYPDLQRLQVSCHAAHEKEGSMRPCGKCEKCRRIIGMLTALDEDPARCGYTPDQISYGLRALANAGVKQIGSDAAHLYYLLTEGEHIERNERTIKLAKAHPHIVKLRFDRERSNPEDLPAAVRKPLFEILRTYADGVVQFRDHNWQNITIPADYFASTPYHIKAKPND